MRSRTSFFNRTVFWSDQRHFWPLTAGYALLWLLLLPLTRLTVLDHQLAGMHPSEMLHETLELTAHSGYWVAFFTAILFAMAAFSYLTNPRATNGLHALSARRETLYATHFLAGLCPQLASQLLAVLLAAAVLASHGAFDAGVTGMMLLALMLPTIFFYSFAVFCMTFTGQILAAPVFYAALNFLVVGVEFLLRTFAGSFLYGWPGTSAPTLTAFSPLMKLMLTIDVDAGAEMARTEMPDGSVIVDYIQNGPLRLQGLDWLLLYALIGLVLAALGLLVYRSRPSEATGSTVAIGWAKPIFKYGVAFCTALALGQLLYYLFFGQYRASGDYSLAGTLACMAAAGLIGYFLAEMLLKKSFHVFRSGWMGAAAVALALVLLGVVMSFDLWGYESRVPDAAQVRRADVQWSSYTGNSFSARVEDAETLRLVANAHRALVADKQRQLATDRNYLDYVAQYELGEDASEPNPGEHVCDGYFSVSYTLKNGSVVTRRYSSAYLFASELDDPASPAAAMTALYNAPGVKLQSVMDYGVMHDYDTWGADPRTLPELRFTGGYFSQSVWSDGGAYVHDQERDLTAAEAQDVYEAILRDVAAGRISDSLFRDDISQSRCRLELYATYRDDTDYSAPNAPTRNADEDPGRRTRTYMPRITKQMTETIATLEAMGIELGFQDGNF